MVQEEFEKWICSSSFRSDMEALRSAAKSDGIQESYKIQPWKDEKFIAESVELKKEINCIHDLLSLSDCDLENNADEAGLTSEQYRGFLRIKLRNLEIQLKLLNEPVLTASDVLLAYSLYRYHRDSTNRKEFHADIEKERRKNGILEIFLIFVSMLCLILFCLFNNSIDQRSEPHTFTISDNNYEEESPKKFYVTSNGTKYHVEGCSSIAGKRNLKAFESEKAAKHAGYEPCKLCIGEESN